MVTLEQMLDSGVHFGHQVRKWNPKMAPYIYGERNGIHIIDILQTLIYLEECCKFLFQASQQGKTILFVGTKRQATKVIESAAIKAEAHYVNQRWLGGMLTNWSTMQICIEKLKVLEKQELDGTLDSLPKKESSLLKKRKEKLEKYFGGVKNMSKIPDIVVIVGQPKEANAVKECLKLNIRTISLLDTNCNPQLADLFIPANDDSIRSVELIINELTDAIINGRLPSGE
uniref:Small ribosomal subunit protein uS2c n=1 Tax=Cymbomonas tetramitiformis TaxID=36881 RepID=A0A166QIS6_9CHLO|nr:ribosomal protein S2 [Cymbomonas tetramitiformis]ANA56916.1 ribosomal protein S2 [Cymbomonas tetramitiformis]